MFPKIIGIIPARYDSVRFPGKPLVSISGKTLIQRTYENALQASNLDILVVATDDRRIFEHVQGFGGKAIMTAPACPTGTDRLAEVLQRNPDWLKADVVVNIQGDEPCIAPQAIEELAKVLIQEPTVSMSTLAAPLRSEEEAFNPSIVKCVVDLNQHAMYFSRTLIPANKQLIYKPEQPYLRHIGLYAYRPSFILTYHQLGATPLQLAEDLEQLKVLEHGFRIKVLIVEEPSIDVNHPEDINKVEEWICKQNTFL